MNRDTMASASVQQTIEQKVREFMDMVSKKDAAGLARLYSDSAVLMPPNRDKLTGRKGIEQFWREMIGAGVKRLQLEPESIEEYAGLASETGRYTVYLDSNEPADNGKYLVLWREENGELKICRDIWNSNRPVTPA